ncbi:unnamed protein product [Soboliphyme baturini]|uniref:Molecular chaperone HtpG n=1 Tax=Soboliphyme baturini TaxID=241478 RepID=A0A183IL43_9BILA|nr:unnamed protein product [Soboliphyme baturini]
MLLDIVAKSLYSEKEVFVRELISNACDALEKLRYFLNTSSEKADFSSPMEIRIDTNKLDRTIIIEDTGVGMTREELIDNLGTIAKSGTANLVKELRDKGEISSLDNVIGQFGVGFYSSFIVADKIEVYTKSYKPEAQGYCWTSSGDGFYEVTEADIAKNGTKIILHLKSGDAAEFADEQTVKEIINKYSSFIGFPIVLNGKRINTVEAIWILDPKSITDKMHADFYNFISHTKDDKPYYTYHFKTDAPLNISALLYTPETGPSLFMRTQDMHSSVSLYSRRVLIQPNTKDILPPWLRFLRGVIDSEDVPLNLSRELLQKTSVIR